MEKTAICSVGLTLRGEAFGPSASWCNFTNLGSTLNFLLEACLASLFRFHMTTRGKKEYSRNNIVRNYIDSEARKLSKFRAAMPTSANPGSMEKVIILRARVIHGIPLFIEERQMMHRELPENAEF